MLEIARQAELAFNHFSHYESMMTLLGAYTNEPQMSQVRPQRLSSLPWGAEPSS